MGQGAQSKGLIIAAQTAGWDPTKIMPGGEDISNFDKAPELFANQAGTGAMPGGSPDSWPDGYSRGGLNLDPSSTVRFNAPDAGRETAQHGTRNADPFAGMGFSAKPGPAPKAPEASGGDFGGA